MESKSLDQIISVSGKEKERLEKYSYEFFITYTPDQNGNTSTTREKTVAASTGSSITEGTSYKSSDTNMGTHYTIFSCGCKGIISKCKTGESRVIKLRADVVLVQ